MGNVRQANERTKAEIELRALQSRFETWRRRTPEPRRIPDDLWLRADALANRLAPSRVTKLLRLSYADFVRRRRNAQAPGASTGLVELRMSSAPVEQDGPNTRPLADIKKNDGSVLRLYANEGEIIRAFLRA